MELDVHDEPVAVEHGGRRGRVDAWWPSRSADVVLDAGTVKVALLDGRPWLARSSDVQAGER